MARRKAQAELEDIVVDEVSTVPRAANGKRFAVVKADDGREVPVELVADGHGGVTTKPVADAQAVSPLHEGQASRGTVAADPAYKSGDGEADDEDDGDEAKQDKKDAKQRAKDQKDDEDEDEDAEDAEKAVGTHGPGDIMDGPTRPTPEQAASGQMKAEWSTAEVNDLPDSSFLVVEGGGEKDSEGKTTPRSLRHFPVKDKDGKADLPHIRNALSRIPQSSLSQAQKDKATAEANRMLESASKGVDPDQGDTPIDQNKLKALHGELKKAMDAHNDVGAWIARIYNDLAGSLTALGAVTTKESDDQGDGVATGPTFKTAAANNGGGPNVPAADVPASSVALATATKPVEDPTKAAQQHGVPESADVPGLANLHKQVEELSGANEALRKSVENLTKANAQQGQALSKILNHWGAGNAAPVEKSSEPADEHKWPSVIEPRNKPGYGRPRAV